MPKFLLSICLLIVGAFSTNLFAQNNHDKDNDILSSAGFLGAHQDLKWRVKALEEFEKGNYDYAMTHFKRAARYADKPSQALISELLWEGKLVPQDRPAAYAWIDLAAEREYRIFVVKREILWEQLSEAEREQAIRIGTELYTEYGDAVAQPRMEKKLERARGKMTGSRVGMVGNMRIEIYSTNGNYSTVSADEYYSDKYWKPKNYWQWQADVWNDPPTGVVTIKPLIKATEPIEE